MEKVKADIIIDKEHCKGCEICNTACPVNILGMSNEVNAKGYHFAMKISEGCIGCTSCALVCPDGVISVYKVKE